MCLSRGFLEDLPNGNANDTEVNNHLTVSSRAYPFRGIGLSFDPFNDYGFMLKKIPSCFASSLKAVCISDFDKKPLEMDLLSKQKSNTKGFNYASGTAGILPNNSRNIGENLPLGKQVKLFKETVEQYLPSLGAYNNRAKLSNALSKSIFVVCMGSNDYINYLEPGSNTSKLYNAEQFGEFLVNELGNHLQELYNLGARKFVVFEIAPLGCLPDVIDKTKPLTICDEQINGLVSIFNTNLGVKLNELKSILSGSTFVTAKSYQFIHDIIHAPLHHVIQGNHVVLRKSMGVEIANQEQCLAKDGLYHLILFLASRESNTVRVLGNYAGILAFSVILAKSNQEERERDGHDESDAVVHVPLYSAFWTGDNYTGKSEGYTAKSLQLIGFYFDYRTQKQEEQHTREVHCSRERSRAAWKIIEEYLMPFVEREKYEISRNCRLHPENDIFRDQEQHKIPVDINEWRCGYCNKIFEAEKFLDQHFDSRHYDLLNVSHSKCLADLCGALHCDLVVDSNSKLSKTKCNTAAAARNHHLCESLASSCFPVNHSPSANRLHELFLRQFCDAHTCSGGRKPFSRGGRKHTSILYLAISILTLMLLPIFYVIVYLYQRENRKGTQVLKRVSQLGQKAKPS
ncbi:hypothetical protein RHGRI_009832 [Rhododendron griersonianum]|uniref:C2H2-type domain-containing protein n=1 Tax=Rhododendron griersonianum TaxID=479676 RepID=A0AAV6KGV9_9ERIC|nr:hypothetical protein RHGRI_009832 [Rhododendron griersonianum]